MRHQISRRSRERQTNFLYNLIMLVHFLSVFPFCGRTLFYYTGEFIKILLREKRCICSALESKKSEGKEGSKHGSKDCKSSFCKSWEQYETIFVLASVLVFDVFNRASRRRKNPRESRRFFSYPRKLRTRMAQYSRVISLSVSSVILFLADVSKIGWYSETMCAQISSTPEEISTDFFSLAWDLA